MPSLASKTLQIITSLQEAGVEPILYGSQGVSLYVGAFKKFGDVDLLVDDRWVKKDWRTLITIMTKLGFDLHNEHEHEFVDSKNTVVAFASIDILVRDGVALSPRDAIQEFTVGGKVIRTLKPEIFLKAYKFSEKDGYRKEIRGKKDDEVIALIKDHLDTMRS